MIIPHDLCCVKEPDGGDIRSVATIDAIGVLTSRRGIMRQVRENPCRYSKGYCLNVHAIADAPSGSCDRQRRGAGFRSDRLWRGA